MREEPEQVLPEQRIAAAGAAQRPVPLTTSPLGRKKLVPATPIHQLQDAGGLERRKREQQQERGHELRPDEERQAHQRQSRARAAARS